METRDKIPTQQVTYMTCVTYKFLNFVVYLHILGENSPIFGYKKLRRKQKKLDGFCFKNSHDDKKAKMTSKQ